MNDAPSRGEILAFAHIGDLHVTDADRRNFLDLMSIAAQIETQAGAQLDFVALPGDCADHGLPEQYRIIAAALRMISIPVRIIPGDHDMEPGSLANFYAGLGAEALPAELRVKGHRCLFLDFCGVGTGGPDFRLGDGQLAWLAERLADATSAGEAPVVFMHSYPADLADPAEASRVTQLLAEHRVALVDMGHTHHNELANDGTTIFAATRSTGQHEEGPVGYSVVTIDRGVVSWRFKLLEDPFPFVMITSPADHRLLRDGAPASAELGVRVFGPDPVASVEYQVDDGPWTPLQPLPGGTDWRAPLAGGTDRYYDLTVRAVTQTGRPGIHTISVAGPGYVPPRRHADGSDAASIGAWPANGIFGTQLGPNRNGRKW